MAGNLSESQAAALFDILTHYNTYAEIRDFRNSDALQAYGPPFTAKHKKLSTSPSLQTLVSRFLLNLPGLKDLPEDFWKVHCHDIIQDLEDADLSESYDKGVIGSRKTLSTAISALIEYPVRGTYGGFAPVKDRNDEYNIHDAGDLSRSFRDFMDQSIYGTILEDTVDRAADTDQLTDHEPVMQAVHEFMLVNLASFMHYTLILSPKGQYLVKLMDNINKLIPYILVRQTLKIGNVASMINAMVKIGLAKMSIASMTNWIGLTKTEDEGMNLMQQIISTVLNWDNKDLEARAHKIEKDKNGPSKEQLHALKEYLGKSRVEHDRIRKQSQQESISIVTSILQSAGLSTDISESNHKEALEYLSVNLSIRDRKEIVRILCHSSPDHLTTTVRSLVTAYEPVIRQMHKAIDLADTVYDMEIFLKDMLKLSKVQPPGKDGKSAVPTVGDFVQLLKKHQYSCHKFIHQCCKNGKEVTSWYLEWAKKAASQFKRAKDSHEDSGAGNLTNAISKLFDNLPEEKRDQIIPILDAQTRYLEETHDASVKRLETVIRCAPSKNPAIAKIFQNSASRPASRNSSRPSSRAPSPTGEKKLGASPPSETSHLPPPAIDSDPGPGAYLARWQDLLDSTPITPLIAKGDVKHATSKQVVQNSAVDVDGEKMADYPGGKSGAEKVQDQTNDDGRKVKKPDVRVVIEALGENFRHLLAEESIYW